MTTFTNITYQFIDVVVGCSDVAAVIGVEVSVVSETGLVTVVVVISAVALVKVVEVVSVRLSYSV